MAERSQWFSPWDALIGAGIAAALAGIVSAVTRIGFWPAFLIALFAMIANGVLAEYEDNLPGGLNNPRPPDDPRT